MTPTEYYNFLKMAKFTFVTLGIRHGMYTIQASVDLLKQLGY